MSMYDFNLDAVSSMRIQRLSSAVPILSGDGTYAVDRFATLTSVSVDAISNGLIDLTNPSGLITIGAIPPSVNESGFAYTSTGTTITWYWDGTNASTVLVIRRTDGTRQTVPAGSITITGLSNSTWYGFLPFWVNDNRCNIGWVQGTAGTPQIAFPGGTGAAFVNTATVSAQADAFAGQLLQGREQLSAGFMTAKTAAGGGTGGGGAGGGGSSGLCVMRGTHIETLGEYPYKSILAPETDWWRIVTKSGRSINSTHNHSLYNADAGKVRADSFRVGQWAIAIDGEDKIVESHPFKRQCTKELVSMDNGHLYWGNGLLNHNSKAVDQS